MNIGKLNRKVEILTFVWNRDSYGGQEGKWVTTDIKWAKIEPVSGTEYYTSQQVSAETIVKITLRFTTSVTVLNRIRYGTSVYEIIGVSDDKMSHKATILDCKEIVNDELQRKATEGKNASGRSG